MMQTATDASSASLYDASMAALRYITMRVFLLFVSLRKICNVQAKLDAVYLLY